jgi:hypothetical protein
MDLHIHFGPGMMNGSIEEIMKALKEMMQEEEMVEEEIEYEEDEEAEGGLMGSVWESILNKSKEKYDWVTY